MTAVKRFFHQRGIKDVFFILALNFSIEMVHRHRPAVGPSPPSMHTQKQPSVAHSVCSSSRLNGRRWWTDGTGVPEKNTNTNTHTKKKQAVATAAATNGRALDYCSNQAFKPRPGWAGFVQPHPRSRRNNNGRSALSKPHDTVLCPLQCR